MSNDRTKAFRQKIADAFLKSLSEDPRNWKKEWMGSHVPINGESGRRYSGINRFLLQYMMAEMETSDPRFYTYRQVEQLNEKSEENIHVKRGSKGFEVEFWSFWYPEEKRKVSYQEAAKLQEEGKEVKPMARYYHVFHASQIEGLPAYEKNQNMDVKESEIINNIAIAMRLQLRHDGGDRAFYSPISDSVHLPRPEAFHSEHAYIGTALHELAHATGAKHRLNRTFGQRGSEEYAREELVAEITSCFACDALNFSMSDEHFENHKAYVQSWISQIKEKPEVLMKAIKEAEKASDYLEKAVFMEQTLMMEQKKQQEQKKTIEPFIDFFVAESLEFPDLGEYRENLTLREAFDMLEQIPSDRIRGGKGIGFKLHDGSIYDNMPHDLTNGKVVYEENINHIDYFRENLAVQKAISECKEEINRRDGKRWDTNIDKEPARESGLGKVFSSLRSATERVTQGLWSRETETDRNSKTENTAARLPEDKTEIEVLEEKIGLAEDLVKNMKLCAGFADTVADERRDREAIAEKEAEIQNMYKILEQLQSGPKYGMDESYDRQALETDVEIEEEQEYERT